MPRKDGTGPLGQGQVAGKGMGNGLRRGGQNGAAGVGPSGYCICPNCGEKINHTAGVPCTSVKCPKCGSPMIRGS